jgi:hypothetical protein
MAYKGYSILLFPHDPASPEMIEDCRVCGDRMSLQRNVMCAGGWAAAMGGHKRPHDVFTCPNKEAPWHIRAELICLEIERTSSPSLKRMMGKDVKDICKRRRV